jgi:hypothetical protein
MGRILPFALVIGLGLFGASYVVETGRYSCRWTVIGYVCPPPEVVSIGY